jgi:hypothetical protein
MTATTKKKTDSFDAHLDRVARMYKIPLHGAKIRAKVIRKALLGLGRAEKHTGGRTIVYAERNVPFHFSKSRHVVKALVKDPIDCPIAKALNDSWLREYISSTHVGNATVSLWSVYCPDIVVKYLLSPPLREAVRNWDEQKKTKARPKFNLEDGIYYLSRYPESLRHTTEKPERALRTPRGKNVLKRTRRLTVKTDISFALAFTRGKNSSAKPSRRKKSA